jgi:LysM repeat protein
MYLTPRIKVKPDDTLDALAKKAGESVQMWMQILPRWR